MRDTLDEIEDIQDELRQLRRDIFSLKCADERLYTNGNGNLKLYQSMLNREQQLENVLRELGVSDLS